MLAVKVRSGLEETSHDGAVAVVDPDGSLIAHAGDIDRPFFLRSAAKPFQAHVSQQNGAGLEPLHLAMTCASHRGLPVHIALVGSILGKAGLDASYLRCPKDWPLNRSARDHLVRKGAQLPRKIWHNCSGKHAGFLGACVASDWDLETYLDPGHPLQQEIVSFVSELGEVSAAPVGVDGCGAPVLRTTTRAMALLFARLGTYSELDEVFAAMHRYPAIVGQNGSEDSSIATATHAAAKGGAEGCLGVALKRGPGVAVKSWDGAMDIAGVGAVATLDSLGVLTDASRRSLEPIARPPQYGGGEPRGFAESRLELRYE